MAVNTSMNKQTSTNGQPSPMDDPVKYLTAIILAASTPKIAQDAAEHYAVTGQLADPKAILGSLVQNLGKVDVTKNQSDFQGYSQETEPTSNMQQQGQPQAQQPDWKPKGNFFSIPTQVNPNTGEVIPANILGGLISQSPTQTGLMLDNQLKGQKIIGKGETKGVYGFDPVSGKVTLQANVPKDSDVRNMTSQTGIETLPQEQQVAAYGLARKVAGVRGAEKILPSIVANLKSGISIDKIEDGLRMQSQSPEFTGPLRDAAQSIAVDKSESQRNVAFDALDDYTQKGDTEGAKEYLKRMALTSGTADQQNQIMQKERTTEFLGEIRSDLDTLEKNGVPTGFLKGSYENMLARVGQVKDPEMRKVATKIAIAVMNYRRSMTGVQFGMIENEEYKRLFPGINRTGDFNTANLNALEETLHGDLKKFYSLSMGRKNYEKLFDNKDNNDLSSMSDEELRKIAGK